MVETLVQKIETDIYPLPPNFGEDLSSTVGMTRRRHTSTTAYPRDLSVREFLACFTAGMLIFYATSELPIFKRITEMSIKPPQALTRWVEDIQNYAKQYCSRVYPNQF